jgi:sugar/nucleoside kinase (ribokinase family)
MHDVLGFGENSIDYVYRLPALPVAGTSKLPIARRAISPGGQVATTMAACAALGLRASYAGAIGDDEAGALMRQALEARSVDLRHARSVEAPNRYAVILVDERHGDRVVLWERDARLAIGAGDTRTEWLEGTRLLHVDAVDDAASLALATAARDRGMPVTCDVDTVTPATGPLLSAVSMPILAEPVPSQLTGEADPERALRQLRARHGGTVVVTLGDRGSMLFDGDSLHRQPAFTVQPVDTTSAGDVFRAGIIYGVLNGFAANDLLRFANAAAAACCTKAGAMASVPTLADVVELMGG